MSLQPPSNILSSETNQTLTVKVAFAQSTSVETVILYLPLGSNIKDALNASGFIEKFGLQFEEASSQMLSHKIGIYGKVINNLNGLLKPNDRVEIYTPLIASATEARYHRVKLRQKEERRLGRL